MTVNRSRWPTATRHRAGERGLVATEFAVLMSVLLVVIVALFSYTTRVGRQDQSVSQAAHDAARAASRARTPAEAVHIATSVAEANLIDSGCGTPQVAVEPGPLTPGSWVTVTVTCTRDNSDLAILGVPGTRTATATASEVVDAYRSSLSPAPSP